MKNGGITQETENCSYCFKDKYMASVSKNKDGSALSWVLLFRSPNTQKKKEV